MTFGEIRQGLNNWVAAMNTTVERVNTMYPPETAQLRPFREGHALVKYSADAEIRIEQSPGLLLEILDYTPSAKAGVTTGDLVARLYIHDDAVSEAEVDERADKWLDVVARHLHTPQASIGSSKISVTSLQLVLGAVNGSSSSGDINTIQLSGEVKLSVSI